MIKILVLILISKLLVSAFFVDSFFVYLPDILVVSFVLIKLSMLIFYKSRFEYNIFFSLVTLLLMLSCITISALINNSSWFDGVVSLIRTISPLMILVLFLLLLQRNEDYILESDRIALYLLVLSVFSLTIFGAFFLEKDMNRGSLWLGTIFGGLHESSYTLASSALLAFALYHFKKGLSSFLFFCFSAIFSMMMISFGWGVRTIALACLLFYSTLIMRRIGLRPAYFLIIMAILITIILSAMIIFGMLTSEDIVHATSGRLAMYLERVIFLSNNSFLEWAFGHGAGSDLMDSDVWWWGEKGAHNDFLTFLTEHGVVFLLSLMGLVYCLFTLLKCEEGRVLLLIFLMTSLMSNGYLVRPGAAYSFMFALLLLSSKRSASPKKDSEFYIYDIKKM